MTTTKTTYGIMISAGNGPYRWIGGGWDTTYGTRAEAEAAKRRADAQEGWTARVVELEPDEHLAGER